MKKLLQDALNVIEECVVDPQNTFGPSYGLACERREIIISKLKNEINKIKNED